MITEKTLKKEAAPLAQQPLPAQPDFWQGMKNSPFFIKLFNWEFWPAYISNIPLAFIMAWFALRARRPFFFTAVNPVIETGGTWGESKFNILDRIPAAYLPKTVFVEKGTGFEAALAMAKSAGLPFPLIAKPNVGERGMLVSKIKDEQGLRRYMTAYQMDVILQEFLDLPVELAVMHHRFPGAPKGSVTSICIKELLQVTGDGVSTIRQLMAAYPRALLQLPRFEAGPAAWLDNIPPAGQTVELEPIGNHCRGTMFLNGNAHIDEALTAVFDEVAFQMDDIYYGRFDLKCTSIEDIRNGHGFMVMEYNGIAAEPAHIYDPSYPLPKKFRDMYRHWKTIYEIYKVQKANGVACMTIPEATESLKKYFAYKKSVNGG